MIGYWPIDVWPEKNVSHAGPFAADARQRPGVSHRIGAAAAIFDGHRHAEQIVLFGQLDGLIVVAMLDIAELFAGAQLLAIGVDVGQYLFASIRCHVDSWRKRLFPER